MYIFAIHQITSRIKLKGGNLTTGSNLGIAIYDIDE